MCELTTESSPEDDCPPRPLLLKRQSQRGDQIILAPHPERPVPVVCISRDLYLVHQLLLGESPGLRTLRQVNQVGWEERLKAGHKIRLPEAHLPVVDLGPSIPKDGVDVDDLGIHGPESTEINDKRSEARGVQAQERVPPCRFLIRPAASAIRSKALG